MVFPSAVDNLGEAMLGSFEPFFLDFAKAAKALDMAEEASASSVLCGEIYRSLKLHIA